MYCVTVRPQHVRSVSYTHLDVYKRQIQASETAFLRGVKRCSKLDRIRNEPTREELEVFNLNEKLKDYKQRWKEHLERTLYSRLTKQVWKYKPIGHR